MDDALLVRRLERVGDLPGDGPSVGQRHGPTGNHGREVFALDELHHERVLLDAVDRRDVRMIQRGEHLRFAREPGEAIRIGGEQVGQDFDRDAAIELGVARPVDLTHASDTQGRDDFIGTQLGTDGQGHRAGILREVQNSAGFPRKIEATQIPVECASDESPPRLSHQPL